MEKLLHKTTVRPGRSSLAPLKLPVTLWWVRLYHMHTKANLTSDLGIQQRRSSLVLLYLGDYRLNILVRAYQCSTRGALAGGTSGRATAPARHTPTCPKTPTRSLEDWNMQLILVFLCCCLTRAAASPEVRRHWHNAVCSTNEDTCDSPPPPFTSSLNGYPAELPLGSSTILGRIPERVSVISSTSDVFVSVKTTTSYHASRLSLLLLTWLQTLQSNQVCYHLSSIRVGRSHIQHCNHIILPPMQASRNIDTSWVSLILRPRPFPPPRQG